MTRLNHNDVTLLKMFTRVNEVCHLFLLPPRFVSARSDSGCRSGRAGFQTTEAPESDSMGTIPARVGSWVGLARRIVLRSFPDGLNGNAVRQFAGAAQTGLY